MKTMIIMNNIRMNRKERNSTIQEMIRRDKRNRRREKKLMKREFPLLMKE